MLWRKIFDRNPLFVIFCDKIAAKAYSHQKVPGIRVPKNLWIGEDIGKAPAHLFDEGVFVKANHGCGFNLAVPKGLYNPARLGRITGKWLKRGYGGLRMEWAYSGVKRRLFVEEMVTGHLKTGLVEINVRCGDGEAVLLSILINSKRKDAKISYYDIEGNRLSLSGNPMGELPKDFVLPSCLAECVSLAEKLSVGIDYARYDFLWDGGTLYGGEITVYPSGGLSKATQEGRAGYDTVVNPYWDLKKSWFFGSPQRGWRGAYCRWLKKNY
jgi:hypothetical protein